MSHSTKPGRQTNDRDFPLWQRKDGRWCRKIKGRFFYFGTDRQAALNEWLRVKDHLLAGRTPPPKENPDAITIAGLCNQYLTAVKENVAAGETSQRTFGNAYVSCARLVEHFGKSRLIDDLRPDDFAEYRSKLSAGYAPNTVNTQIARCKAVFSWAFETGLIETPVKTGPGFKSSQKAVRRRKALDGQKMYEADEIRKLLNAATVPMRAMILMAANCAFGNHDLANLPKSALDLANGWVQFARMKTGVARRCPLWPETVAALARAIENRPRPLDPADDALVFITHRGYRWVRSVPSKVEGVPPRWHDAITLEFAKLLKQQKLSRPGRNFYALRHTHRTISDEVCDAVASAHLMGHIDGSMAGAYRERIADERLQRVTDHVRNWLFGTSQNSQTDVQ